jgi:hypothetical protein
MFERQTAYAISTVGTSRLQIRSDLQTEAAGSSEMLVKAKKTTRRHIQEERRGSCQFHDPVTRSFNSKMAVSKAGVLQCC